MTTEPTFDPALDLVLEREVDVPPNLVWAAWTTPEHVKRWFAPEPYTISECELDLRPGGIFRTVMRTPEGDEMEAGSGCVLEVVENERFVFTEALGVGFRPKSGELPFTAIITMEPTATGTRYKAVAVHGTPETREAHEKMGFAEGWGMVLDQLVAYVKTL